MSELSKLRQMFLPNVPDPGPPPSRKVKSLTDIAARQAEVLGRELATKILRSSDL